MTIALPQQNIKMDVLTGIDPVWYDKLKALTDAVNLLAGISPSIPANLIHASLGADFAISNSVYTDGPSITQGSTGTWWVSGNVTVEDLSANSTIFCKLWDGTTVIDSASLFMTAGASGNVHLSGWLAAPVANLKISCKSNSTTGFIRFNKTGNSRDSTISAFRIA